MEPIWRGAHFDMMKGFGSITRIIHLLSWRFQISSCRGRIAALDGRLHTYAIAVIAMLIDLGQWALFCHHCHIAFFHRQQLEADESSIIV
jgi:hypothetical protein